MGAIDIIFGSSSKEWSVWPYDSPPFRVAVNRIPLSLDGTLLEDGFFSRIPLIDAKYYFTVILIKSNHYMGLIVDKKASEIHLCDSFSSETAIKKEKALIQKKAGPLGRKITFHGFAKFQSNGLPEGSNACGILSVSIAFQLLCSGFKDYKVVLWSNKKRKR